MTWYWDPYFYWYQYENEIYSNEAPFFAACSYNNQNNGHAIVLRGYYNYVNISQVGILCYMDPITGSYGASTVATDGDFYYIPMGSSTWYRLFGFLAVSE